MRFLFDENVHRGLLSVLTALGHDVQLSPKGLSNGKVLALAVSEHRILVTHDEDFARQPLPSPHAGVILVKIPSRRFEPLKHAMSKLLTQRPSSEQFRATLTLLFEDRFEQQPTTFEDTPL